MLSMNSNSIDIVGIRLVSERRILSKHSIESPFDAVEVLANELKYLDREILMSINLNNKNEIINAHVCSIGTINMSLCDPKSIFKAALLSNASSVMLIHNHPSGHCDASEEDVDTTDNLVKAGHILGINVLDHIIVGMDEYYSIMSKHKFQFERCDYKGENMENQINENEEIVLMCVGTDFWSRPVYKVGDTNTYVKDIGLGYGEPLLYWSCPKNDPDGEPDYPFTSTAHVVIIELDAEEIKREDQKFVIAKMIAANEFVVDQTSISWLALASGIHDIQLTKELLQELKENPVDLTWTSEYGYIRTENLELLENDSDDLEME